MDFGALGLTWPGVPALQLSQLKGRAWNSTGPRGAGRALSASYPSSMRRRCPPPHGEMSAPPRRATRVHPDDLYERASSPRHATHVKGCGGGRGGEPLASHCAPPTSPRPATAHPPRLTSPRHGPRLASGQEGRRVVGLEMCYVRPVPCPPVPPS